MIRTLLILFGVVEIILPKAVIDACERIGLENPDEATLRPGADLLARLEGVIFVWLLVRGRENAPITSKLLGLAGTVAVVYPKPLIRISQSFAYENSSELELRSWVEPAARLLGILYLLVLFLSGRNGNEESSERETPV
ncbi:MAG: hypothetical protein V5A52_00465 [Halovenus sp.]|uniref:hypothetical protein n=1 Tax=Halovenus amylolytica TaxID=2500550 RepID=UPI000FE43681